MRILIAMFLLCSACSALAQPIQAPTRVSQFDWQCQSADGAKLSDHQRFDTAFIACWNNPTGAQVQGGTYRLNRSAPEPAPEPPTCPLEPAAETRSQSCQSGSSGAWTQTRSYTSVAPMVCWQQGEWLPVDPPAGACVDDPVPPPDSLAAPVISTTRADGTNPGRSNITISWASVERATAYVVERCSGPTCVTYQPLATVAAPALSYLNSNLPGGLTFKYRVRAAVDAEVSAYSNIVAVQTPATLPASGSIGLSWTTPTQNNDNSPLTDLAGFRVVYGRSVDALSQTVQIPNPSTTTYLVSGLASGTWVFAATAYASGGAESALSNIVSKTVP